MDQAFTLRAMMKNRGGAAMTSAEPSCPSAKKMGADSSALSALRSANTGLGCGRGSKEPKYTELNEKGNGPRILAFASGKGGVGKTAMVANLGALLARKGHRVLLVDGDFGLANLDIVLGLSQPFVRPPGTIEEALAGRQQLQDVWVGVAPHLWLLPASSGANGGGSGDPSVGVSGGERNNQKLWSDGRLESVLAGLPWEMDYILVDAGAGQGAQVQDLHGPHTESVIVLTPEPTSLADGYSLIKTLYVKRGVNKFRILVNQVADARQALQAYHRLESVVRRFLGIETEFLGHVTRDEGVSYSVMQRRLYVDLPWDGEGANAVHSNLEWIVQRLSLKSENSTFGAFGGNGQIPAERSERQGPSSRRGQTAATVFL